MKKGVDALRFWLKCKSDNPSLYWKISESLSVFKSLFQKYPKDHICFSFNGGKDCTAVLYLLSAALIILSNEDILSNEIQENGWILADTFNSENLIIPELSILLLYFKTKNEFPEVVEFMKEIEEEFQITIRPLGDYFTGLQTIVDEGMEAVIMGTRRTDPDGVSMDFFSETTGSYPRCMRVTPILNWNYSDVWTFLRGFNGSFCSLYAKGYTSLGSVHNTHPNPLLLLPGSEHPDESKKYAPAWHLDDGSHERSGRY